MGKESDIWEDLFSQGEFVWREPHERVVGLLPALEKLDGNRILDLGCGAGRHIVFLETRDFKCHGTDHALAGLLSARGWLQEEGFHLRLTQSEMDRLPYASSSFDAVLCLYVIYHGTVEKIGRVLQELERLLKPGGISLVTFISDQHHRYGCGDEIEAGTFITHIDADAGIPHHFSSAEEIIRMVGDFRVLELELLERESDQGLPERHWLVLLEKVGEE
jgi:ubiquinone/menaquinone biosynthesis C-methylase UbiE